MKKLLIFLCPGVALLLYIISAIPTLCRFLFWGTLDLITNSVKGK